MSKSNDRKPELGNVNRSNPRAKEIIERPSNPDRSNFRGSELNDQKNKKSIKKKVKVTSAILGVSLIAGGGIAIGSTKLKPVTAKATFEILEVRSRQIEYDLYIETTGPLNLVLKNDFTERIVKLEPGHNFGTFDNLKPETKYNLHVSSNDIFNSTIKKETVETTAASTSDLYLFEDPANHLESKFKYIVYYDESLYQNNLTATFNSQIGETFTVTPAGSGVWNTIDLKEHNLLTSLGQVELTYENNGKSEVLIEKEVKFSKRLTEFRSVEFTPANGEKGYIKFKFDFTDDNNAWNKFILHFYNETEDKDIEKSIDRARNFDISIKEIGFSTNRTNLEIYVAPENDNFTETYIVYHQSITLYKGETE